MTNALGVAAVTAILRDLLDNGIVDRNVAAALGGEVKVSALPPDRIATGTDEDRRLNVYMYHVSPNAALRNASLPARDDRGDLVVADPLALDLHYLVSAYAQKDLDAEVLLGFAALTIHETPVFTREMVARSLRPNSTIDGAVLPPAYAGLQGADLADQAELVRLTPETLGAEEVSRLWTAFQAKHRPSVAFRASVVLLQSQRAGQAALPVLSRGERDASGREAGIASHASLLPPFPTLLAVLPPSGQPAVRTGELLSLQGHHLQGDVQSAQFTHAASGDVLTRPAAAYGNGEGFDVRIPADPPVLPSDDPDMWRAGGYSVAALVRRGASPPRASNAAFVALAPRVSVVAAPGAPGEVILTATCRPKVWRGQRATLLVGERELPAEPIVVAKTDTLTFRARDLPSGPQWVRLRVDGVESLLVDRSGESPRFDPTQQVVIP